MQIIDVTQSKAFQDIIDWSEAGAIEERVPDIVKRYRKSISDPGALWIRQGGCDPLASVGIEHLASEIASYIEASTPVKPWKVSIIIVLMVLNIIKCGALLLALCRWWWRAAQAPQHTTSHVISHASALTAPRRSVICHRWRCWLYRVSVVQSICKHR